MSSTTVASETPLFVKGPDGALFGVMTVPARPNGVGVTLIPAGGYTFTPQRNGWGTNLARMLAADGYHVLRFDWHGIGDSGGSVEGFAHDRPFVDDLSVMLETMEQHGVGRHVLIGHCFGIWRRSSAGARSIGCEARMATASPPPG